MSSPRHMLSFNAHILMPAGVCATFTLACDEPRSHCTPQPLLRLPRHLLYGFVTHHDDASNAPPHQKPALGIMPCFDGKRHAEFDIYYFQKRLALYCHYMSMLFSLTLFYLQYMPAHLLHVLTFYSAILARNFCAPSHFTIYDIVPKRYGLYL